MRLAFALAVACLTAGGLVAQESARIAGVVIDDSNGTPARHAKVVLQIVLVGRSQETTLVALTPEDGKFEFNGLPSAPQEAVYRMRAEKAGFLGQEERDVRLGSNIVLKLTRTGSVTLTVRDTEGNLVAGAQLGYASDRLPPAYWAMGITGADGRIRFDNLYPGGYSFAVISAGTGTLLRVRGLAIERTYYPGTKNQQEAKWIQVSRGEEITLDLRH